MSCGTLRFARPPRQPQSDSLFGPQSTCPHVHLLRHWSHSACAVPCAPVPYLFHRKKIVKSASKRAFKKQNTACSYGWLENTRSKRRDEASAGFISEMQNQCLLASKTRAENTTSANTEKTAEVLKNNLETEAWKGVKSARNSVTTTASSRYFHDRPAASWQVALALRPPPKT